MKKIDIKSMKTEGSNPKFKKNVSSVEFFFCIFKFNFLLKFL